MRFGAALIVSVCASVWSSPSNAQPGMPGVPIVGRYHVSGAKELRPHEISDDGVHTYVLWRDDQELPAVFQLNSRGQEEMVDGYMRGGVFTIDRINERLVFRIDRRAARAERLPAVR